MPRKDPAAHAIYMREVWYPANREKQKRLVRSNEAKLKQLVRDEKERRGGCERCGFNEHPAALDFHHRAGEIRSFGIADALQRALGRARLIAEMAKCDLLCANCHRILHAVERDAMLASAGRTNGKSPPS